MNTQDFIKIEEQYGAHNYHPLDVVIEKAEGVWVYDVDGKKYLDCLSAYSAVNQGHVHPEILKALLDQAKKVTLTSRAFRNDQLPLLYKELSEMTGYDMSLPMNSGAEAVETAVKLARKWAYQVKKVPRHQAEIIVAGNNFHGRTVTIISFSTEPLYRDDFGPFTPGFVVVEYGNADAIEKAITPNTAAVLLEPIQGEAGVIMPPDGYLKKVADICKKNNVLFAADEIQTGLCRTGKLFASDHEGVRPDIVIVGKALSGGFYPVSAVLADKPILGLFTPGEHGSTFGGNPLAAAVARASLKVLREEKLAERSAELGAYFVEQLSEIPSPHVKEVRGKGLLIGVELKPEAGGARRFCETLKAKGILAKETHDNVIRFAPPLVIDKETIDWALPAIRETLNMK
ncbi:MAG: ornithine--oxo-acid transaminase [Chloroflexi bacterium]|nr:ornithine--oxo-acid transaminase [Chloroflexi bacterium CFX1]MCK6568475.1 ornithine--oxo-acid transaminase [Anaerolineales bacterium]MCQ3952422.1 ornithine--oxo-acid transaminase [Chloroflexota bacterium]MDL1918004.1 ornithine--oxo-acid transaminase [Chloroflexi bacterium CFX5]NUQ59014.1 ornithine--oxo-acid transaminase [Anaerolineales bacterium]